MYLTILENIIEDYSGVFAHDDRETTRRHDDQIRSERSAMGAGGGQLSQGGDFKATREGDRFSNTIYRD